MSETDPVLALRVRRLGHYIALVPEEIRSDLDYNPERERYLLRQEDRYGDWFYSVHTDIAGLCRYAEDEYDEWPKVNTWDLDTGLMLKTSVSVSVSVR